MEIDAKFERLEQNLDGAFLVLRVGEMSAVETFITKLKAKDVVLSIKRKFNKRSLAANAYAWKLIELISNELRSDKNETYVIMLKRYGQIAEDAEGNKLIFSVQSNVNVERLYKYVDVIGHGRVGGKDFTHYKALKGSSEFTTEEMSIFIDGIISEAKELEIETLPPAELARIKEDWK